MTIGSSVTINGDLQSDQTALAGAPITITRTEAGSTAAPEVLTATTGTDGSFTLTDTPRDRNVHYTASYAGRATVAQGTRPSRPSSPGGIGADADRAVVVGRDGHAYTLAGAHGGCRLPPAGTPVTITRTAAGSTAAKVFTATTGADGAFTLADNPGAAGTYTTPPATGGAGNGPPARISP